MASAWTRAARTAAASASRRADSVSDASKLSEATRFAPAPTAVSITRPWP